MSVLHVAVQGRVQGVGFRWFVRERARSLGLKGWVRNNVDGSVEVLAVGDGEAVRQLRENLQSGPVGAHVTALQEQSNETAMDALDPFGILK